MLSSKALNSLSNSVQFFTDTLKMHIVKQTNLYALQYMSQEKYDQ